MKIISDLGEHFDIIERLLDNNPDSVFVSSYGLYAGILQDGRDANKFGPKYKTRSIDVLNKMSKYDSKMIIGISDYKSCKHVRCEDCELKYIHSLIRIEKHSEAFPDIKMRIIRGNHLKCFIIRKGSKYLGITGGRNMSDSSWSDISFMIDHDTCLEILAIANKVFDNGMYINDETISKILNEQGIESE